MIDRNPDTDKFKADDDVTIYGEFDGVVIDKETVINRFTKQPYTIYFCVILHRDENGDIEDEEEVECTEDDLEFS